MLPDFGQRLSSLPRTLEFVRDLEEFEGPILSEHRATPEGGLYLEKWCTRQGAITRTLIVRTEQRAVAEYLSGRLSMLDLLKVPSDGIGFLVDREEGREVGVFLVTLAELPPSYLPDPSARHDESLRPHWEVVPQSFLLSEGWDATMLAEIERRYLDAAAFQYLTDTAAGRQLPARVLSYNYDRGFPIAKAFAQIRGEVPRRQRARSAGVSLNSPGVLTIDAPAATAEGVASAIIQLAGRPSAYRDLHQWSQIRPRDIDRMPDTEVALQHISSLCELLGVKPLALLPSTLFISPQKPDKMAVLTAGKLLAAYCRRLGGLLKPKEPGVEFISVRAGRTEELLAVGDDEDEEE